MRCRSASRANKLKVRIRFPEVSGYGNSSSSTAIRSERIGILPKIQVLNTSSLHRDPERMQPELFEFGLAIPDFGLENDHIAGVPFSNPKTVFTDPNSLWLLFA